MQHPNDPIRLDRMPDSFYTSVPSFHDIDPTEFHEVSEAPPAYFDEGSTPFKQETVAIPAPARAPAGPSFEIIAPIIEQRPQYGEVQFVASPSPFSFVAIAIARAITGAKEVSLVSERENGEHQRYVLHIKGLHEPSMHAMPLVESIKPRRKKGAPESPAQDVPIPLEAAMIVFDGAVTQEFKAAVLRNGKTVPTHVTLLYPPK